MTGLTHYELRAQVAAPPKVAARARNAEPKELFVDWIDGITAAGFVVIGEVGVRPMAQCGVCGASYCEEHSP